MLQSFVEELEKIVKEKMLPLEGTAHSYAHVDRVVKTAVLLAKKEEADAELVRVGAIPHDVGRCIGQPHNESGATLASKILKGLNYSPQKTRKIARIVLLHDIGSENKLHSLEEKIVWDADKIDLLGAVGLARGFHWCGKQSFDSAVKLAFETYTPIYDTLNTKSARKLAKKRNEETISFLSALEKELSLADLGLCDSSNTKSI
jgi:uncharacterized protein